MASTVVIDPSVLASAALYRHPGGIIDIPRKWRRTAKTSFVLMLPKPGANGGPLLGVTVKLVGGPTGTERE